MIELTKSNDYTKLNSFKIAALLLLQIKLFTLTLSRVRFRQSYNLPADYHNHILVLHLQYLHLRQTDSGSLMVKKSSRHIEDYSDSSVDSLVMSMFLLIGQFHSHNEPLNINNKRMTYTISGNPCSTIQTM